MVIIQLLKDTKYPANYQIIIDSSLGNYAVLRDFFSALHEGMGAHGLRGRVPDCACCYQSLDCLCLNGRHFRSITSERPHAPRRSALCATCHSAVLTARGYPSLFGSQCRLVANCHQRADATSGIFYIEAGALVTADKAVSASAVRGYHHSPEAFVPIIGHG